VPRIVPVTERSVEDKVNGTFSRPIAGFFGSAIVNFVAFVRTTKRWPAAA
jgi:hypothetical protein